MAYGTARTPKMDPPYLDMVFVQYKKHDEVMEVAAEHYDKGHVIQNASGLVGRAVSMCIHHRKTIAKLTIVGHGGFDGFYIGSDKITQETLTPGHTKYRADLPMALASLKPYFKSGAMVYIQACWAGNATPLFQALSGLWGVPVLGWNNEIFFKWHEWHGTSVTYDKFGKTVVCSPYVCAYH